ncbi:MAG: hypothetical protein U0802_05285 [Candidatus Binatia bacterium]
MSRTAIFSCLLGGGLMLAGIGTVTQSAAVEFVGWAMVLLGAIALELRRERREALRLARRARRR